MVLPTSPSPADGEASRPQGVGLTAIALGALGSLDFLRALLHSAGSSLTGSLGIQSLLLCLACVLAILVLWQYWKGRDYARVFVLLWSLLIVVQAVAFLADHNLDPAALMAHPQNFLQTLLAVFLLYWLNTPPLRAWFKKISATSADLIAGRLVGKLCTALDFHAFPTSRLTFEHGAELTLSCPWRIVLDDNLAFTHAPAAGSAALPHLSASAPVPDPSSDPDEARRLLQNLRVTAVRLAPHSSDLFLTFEMGIELQTWNPEPAVPAHLWQFSDPGLTVIANADGVSSKPIVLSTESPADG